MVHRRKLAAKVARTNGSLAAANYTSVEHNSLRHKEPWAVPYGRKNCRLARTSP